MKQHLLIFAFLFITSFSFAQDEEKLTTSIQFADLQYDFGEVMEGEKVKYVYSFKNTGEAPLIITNAKGSCGCTVPEWPMNPILPGEEGIIVVQFDTKNKKGSQSKRVTITANTNPAQTFLTIKGKVAQQEVAVQETATAPTNNQLTTEKNWKKSLAKDCFAIFPNPTADILKLVVKEYLGESAHITIFHVSGKEMTNRKIEKLTAEVIEFNVQDYTSGTYYAHIQIGKKTVSTKCFVVAER